MKLSFKDKYINTLFLLGVAVLTSGIFLAYLQIQELITANKMVIHTHNIIAASHATQINLNEIESAVHNYLYNNKPAEIKKFTIFSRIMMLNIDYLKKLTADNPLQEDKINKLQTELTSYINLLQQEITTHNKNQKTVMFSISDLMLEQNQLNKITNNIEDINQEELHLLKKRNLITEINATKSNIILTIVALFGISLLLLSMILLNYYVVIRNRAETARVDLEKRLKRIIDSSDDLIAAVDLNLRFIAFNTAYEKKIRRRFGMQPKIGDSLQDIFSGPESKRSLETWQKAIDGDEFTNITNFDENKKSSHYYEATYKLIRNAQGNIIGAAHIMRDITEKRKVEQLKNEFVSIVSHELRTPLTSIKGSIGLLLGGAVSKLDEKTSSLLKIAYNNCERLIQLINDMLDMEKIESGNILLHIEKFDLAKLLEEAIAANQHYGDKEKITIVLNKSEETLMIEADYARIMQVMNNLISNAIKFSPCNETIYLNLAREGTQARISVTNRGQGIPEEFRKHMFKKFSQADSSVMRKHGGSGLGLNISKAIIEKMGGTIGYESRENISTTFFIKLPLIHVN